MLDFFYNTLSPWQWALLALVPPAIIALYFLKLRRQPLEVPSTYLWKKSIEDLHVNSLWQRLRQNLLLFLQLLLIALAMFALLRPGWQGTKLAGDRFIFLVDNSASMSATDAKDAKNRLDEAKKLVAGMIDQMSSGMTAMIVSFADTPQVVQEFTDNRRLLRERLETIQPTNRSTDLRGALELASGLANPNRVPLREGDRDIDVVEPQPATLYILSDGRFDDVKDFALGNLGGPNGMPVYVPIGTFDAENLAITNFSVRRSESHPEEKQAFVQVSNFTPSAQKATVEIELDGSFLDAKEVNVPAGESSGVVFPMANAPAGKLTARLKYSLDTPDKRDVLAQDDIGYAAINDARPGRVLVVTPGNVALQIAMATQRASQVANIQFKTPDILATDTYKRDAENGAYDLIIYDQCAPTSMPRANTVFIGRLPPGPAWRAKPEGTAGAANPSDSKNPKNAADVSKDIAVGPQIIDWNRSHPLLANVELGNVDIADSLVLHPPPGATELIDSTAGPIAAVAPRDAFQDAVLGFEIVGQQADGTKTVNTNWPRRLSFPTFCLNMLEFMGSGTQDSQLASTRPGRPVELRPSGKADELTVVDPIGKQFAVRRSEGDVFQFQDTNQPGVYDVRQGKKVIERFAVNLFDRQESDVRVRPSQSDKAATIMPADIRIGNIDVRATVGPTPSRTEAWKTVLLCALFVLILEWYIYNRRVYL
ncbi:MAG TPA: BatA and WFA domain-containing protein [Lacipirellulaceae bacterium]|nr:BatA and WFA domain-containing protein [Lacipirellulaceae bacterium]